MTNRTHLIKNTEILEYVVNIVLIRKNKGKALVAHLTSYRILLVLSMSLKIKASPFCQVGGEGSAITLSVTNFIVQ